MDKAGELKTEAALGTVYPVPPKPVRDKVLDHIDVHARRFIALSPFLCIGSSRTDGLAAASPRGGEAGFVHVLDATRPALPDRPGNNRLDTLTNLVHAPAVGLLFFVPGIEEMLRINGIATITTDEPLMARFIVEGKRPRAVVVIAAREVYLHCTKALMRADLWNPERHVPRAALPSLGQMLRDQAKTFIPARIINFALRQNAKRNLY